MAFVEYQDVRYAAQAMATLQGSFLLSSDRGAIRIEYAKSKMAEVGFTNLWIEVGFILCYASRYRHRVNIPTKTQHPVPNPISVLAPVFVSTFASTFLTTFASVFANRSYLHSLTSAFSLVSTWSLTERRCNRHRAFLYVLYPPPRCFLSFFRTRRGAKAEGGIGNFFTGLSMCPPSGRSSHRSPPFASLRLPPFIQ